MVFLSDSSIIRDLGEKLMQHWVEINLVTLQKLIETKPQRMQVTVFVGCPVQDLVIGPDSGDSLQDDNGARLGPENRSRTSLRQKAKLWINMGSSSAP